MNFDFIKKRAALVLGCSIDELSFITKEYSGYKYSNKIGKCCIVLSNGSFILP